MKGDVAVLLCVRTCNIINASADIFREQRGRDLPAVVSGARERQAADLAQHVDVQCVGY